MRIMRIFLAALLCVGLLPATVAAADTTANTTAGQLEAQATESQATLTIVFGLDASGKPDLAVHKTYAFAADATLQSLYDQAVAAGDIEAYELDASGYAKSVTKKGGVKFSNAADFKTYWSMFVDQAYYQGSDSIKTLKLTDGHSYQLVWDSYPTAVAPDWSKLAAADAGNGVVGAAPGGEGADVAGDATLSIANGMDMFASATGAPNIVLNKKYGFTAGTKMKDLLDHAVAQSDLEAYELGAYGFIDSVSYKGQRIANAADFKTYWSFYVDGAYYGGAENINTLSLEAGKSYQLAWESFPLAMAPDWALVGAPEGGAPENGDDDEPTPPDDGTTEPLPTTFAKTKFDTIFNNIAAAYKGSGEDWKALELAAIGRPGDADLNKILQNAAAAYKTPDSTNLQRSIITLRALKKDGSKMTINGEPADLVATMGKSELAQNTPNGKMFALLAYAAGPYVPVEGALADVDNLLVDVMAVQNADGSWSFSGSTPDADMTAIALTALAPYRSSNTAAAAAIDKGLAALKALQLAGGGFASMDFPGVCNANSTAMVIIALSALGIDARSWEARAAADVAADASHECTPVAALMGLSNAEQTGFIYGGQTNNMATEQGFRAMVAYQGFLNANAASLSTNAAGSVTALADGATAYNIYTQAASGSAGLQSTSGTTTPADQPSSLPKTGDNDGLMLMMCAIAALGLGGSALFMRRRFARAQAYVTAATAVPNVASAPTEDLAKRD